MSTPLVNETQPRSTNLLHGNHVSLDLKHHLILYIPTKTTSSEPTLTTCESTCLTPPNMSSPPSTSFSPSLASSPLSTELSFLHSTPVYLCLLSTSIILTLYVTAITDTPTLYTIECLPLYESNIISQELVCLLLDTFHFQMHYIRTIPIPDQALLLLNGELSQCTLNTLHLHGFHMYLECLEPTVLLPAFLPIYQSLSSVDWEHYETIAISAPNEPQIEVTLTPLPVPPSHSPSDSSISLASCISSQPISPSETLVPESSFLCKNALLTTSFVAHSPQGQRLMSALTRTLP